MIKDTITAVFGISAVEATEPLPTDDTTKTLIQIGIALGTIIINIINKKLQNRRARKNQSRK